MVSRSTAAVHPPGLDPATKAWSRSFLAALSDPNSGMWSLFDRNPDMLFVVKDRAGRYVCVSESCVERCGLHSKAEAIGRTAHDLFPRDLADSYVRQDEAIFRTGRPVVDSLELTLYRNRGQGWCLSNKVPLHDHDGKIIGIACMDRDLIAANSEGLINSRLADTIEYIQKNFAQSQRIPTLARMAGLSPVRFDRRMRKIFGISTMQYVIKTRIDVASQILAHSDETLTDIALIVGFSDQSALSRQFKRFTGFTPKQYRKLMGGDGEVTQA